MTRKEGWAEDFYKKPCHESISRAMLLIYIGRNIIIRFKDPHVICDEDGIVDLEWRLGNKCLGILCNPDKAVFSKVLISREPGVLSHEYVDSGYFYYPDCDKDLIGLFQWLYKEEPKT